MVDLLTPGYLNLFRKELKSFIHRSVKDKALAEDLVHDVFLKAHKNSGQLKDPNKLSAWLYQMTRNMNH